MNRYGRTIRLAAVQAAPVWLDLKASLEKACDLIAQAGREGADIVGFPENFLPGHPSWFYYMPATCEESLQLGVRLFKESVEVPGPEVDALCNAAHAAGVDVVMGLTERYARTAGTLFNTQLFIDRNGTVVGKHQKLVPTVGERLVHAPGSPSTQRGFEFNYGPVTALSCGENTNPLAVAMVASNYPVVHVASWPDTFVPAHSGMRESSLLAARNISYTAKCFTISSASVVAQEMLDGITISDQDRGFLAQRDKSGGTAIIGPRGDILAGPMNSTDEGIIYADADLDECIRGRIVHDVSGHYTRSDVYTLLINDQDSGRSVRSRSEALEEPTELDYLGGAALNSGGGDVDG